MLDTTHQKGEIAFLRCALRAAEKGMVLSRPTTEARYDAILDDGKELLRVQVKYGDGRSFSTDGAIKVDLRRKSQSKSAKTRIYTKDEVDAVLAYIPRIDEVVYFPPKVFSGKPVLQVRVETPKNGQKKGVMFAKDYVW